MPADVHAEDCFRRLTRWHVIPDAGTLIDEVCARVYCAARQAIAQQGAFRIVLAGGSTPQKVYRELAGYDADWGRWHVYFGDERCLAADDPERNSMMVARCLLDRVPVPAGQVHVIPAELGARVAAREYARVVDAARPFDMVLLGMGEDGHTASLFPGHPAAGDASVLAVFDAPKPPPERVSLGDRALNDACSVLALVTGASKQAAVRRWRNGEDLPIARMHGRGGLDVYLDPVAAGEQ